MCSAGTSPFAEQDNGDVFFGGCAFVHVETSGYPALADRQTHLLEQIGDRFQVMNFPTK